LPSCRLSDWFCDDVEPKTADDRPIIAGKPRSPRWVALWSRVKDFAVKYAERNDMSLDEVAAREELHGFIRKAYRKIYGDTWQGNSEATIRKYIGSKI